MRILVTGAGGPAGTAVIEYLRGTRHWTLGADVDADTAGHRLADASLIVPAALEPGYADAVAEAVRAHGVEAVIPTVAEEIPPLLGAEQRLGEAGAAMVLPPAAAVETCADKWRFAQVADAASVPVPATSLMSEPPPPGPWIVKPRVGRGSRGVSEVDSADDLAGAGGEQSELVVQTRLSGREFTVDVLADAGGTMVACVPRWRLATRGGVSTTASTFRHAGIERAVGELLTVLGYRGAGNVQGCLDENGEFAFFEMNPRFSGGLPITLAAGANLVEAYLELANGRSVPAALVAWRADVRVVRYLAQAPGPAAGLPGEPAGERGAERVTGRRLVVPLGTRPEIVKLAPVIESLRRVHEIRVVFTGQHTDRAMGAAILEEFGVRADETWRLPRGQGQRLAALVENAERSLREHDPDAVLILGDTHTVPAFCLAASETGVPVIHLEAGLRSYNPRSREETNRRVAAAGARLHLAPTERAAAALRAEGVRAERIAVVGNSTLDALSAQGLSSFPAADRRGVLVTVHRPTTVDDPTRLAEVVDALGRLCAEGHEVFFPLHPRTRVRLVEFGFAGSLLAAGVTLAGPLPYGELLDRLRRSAVVVTDSGGLQEEAAWFAVPCVVLRGSTPRWEGVEEELARLCRPVAPDVLAAVSWATDPALAARLEQRPCPYGDGRTAERVAALLTTARVWRLLRLEEPDWTAGGAPLP